jgi:hypothetical protein
MNREDALRTIGALRNITLVRGAFRVARREFQARIAFVLEIIALCH